MDSLETSISNRIKRFPLPIYSIGEYVYCLNTSPYEGLKGLKFLRGLIVGIEYYAYEEDQEEWSYYLCVDPRHLWRRVFIPEREIIRKLDLNRREEKRFKEQLQLEEK